MTDFLAYAQRMRSGDPDMFLGSLCWYSVAEDASISHDDLKAAMVKSGLDPTSIFPPRDDDVFRRTCSAAQKNRIPSGNGTFINALLRDVSRKNGETQKQLVLEEVDASNEKLSHIATHKVVFYATSSQIAVTPLVDPSPFPHISDMILTAITNGFQAGRQRHNAYAIRELIRKSLVNARAALVRPTGGVYFVMRDNAPTLNAVENLAQRIDGASVHALPLINDAKQREMIRQAYEQETVLEIDRRMAEIDQLMKGPEITPQRFTKLAAEMSELVARTEEYANLLDETMGNANDRIDFYKTKMRKLYDQHVRP